MALEFNYYDEILDLSFAKAYAKVTRVYEGEGEKAGQIVTDIAIYANKSRRDNGLAALKTISLSYPINKTMSLYPDAYDFIKTDGLFNGATDV
jgi:hypothetical protein